MERGEREGPGISLRDERRVEPGNQRHLLPKIKLGNPCSLHRPLAETGAAAALGMRGTATLGLDWACPGVVLVGRGLPMLAARAPGRLFRRRTVTPDSGHALKRASQNPGDCQ